VTRPRHVAAAPRKESCTIPSKIFVGNLSFNVTKGDLTEAMAEAGQVVDVFLPNDRATGRPRGFAFVEFSSQEQAEAAIRLFNGRELGGRPLKVNMAEDRPARPGGSRPPFGGGGGGGYGGGGGFGSEGGGFGRRGPAGGKSKGSRRNLRARKRSL